MLNGKSYIGQTIKTFNSRILKHYQYVKGGSSTAFHNALRKYSKNDFNWEILKETNSLKELNILESTFIEKLNTMHPLGYNLKIGGDNKRLSEETKRKISDANSGKTHPMYGKHHSKETIEKIRKGNIGKKISIETKRKMSKNHANVSGEKHPMYGKKHSEESKRKMSENHADVSGKNNPMYGKKQKRIECPHCKKIGGNISMIRWHFDKCRNKIG